MVLGCAPWRPSSPSIWHACTTPPTDGEIEMGSDPLPDVVMEEYSNTLMYQ